MKSMVNQRIHIAPVGFEIDRIILPAVEMKADLVYLVVHDNPSADKAQKYHIEIQKQLKKKKIKTETVYANRFRLFDIIRIVKELIQENRKDSFYVNVAWRPRFTKVENVIFTKSILWKETVSSSTLICVYE